MHRDSPTSPILSAPKGGEGLRAGAAVSAELLEVRQRPCGARVALEERFNRGGGIEDELVAARGAAELEGEGRAGGLEAAGERDRGMRGECQIIGGGEPSVIGGELLAVDLGAIALLDGEGRHRDRG